MLDLGTYRLSERGATNVAFVGHQETLLNIQKALPTTIDWNVGYQALASRVDAVALIVEQIGLSVGELLAQLGKLPLDRVEQIDPAEDAAWFQSMILALFNERYEYMHEAIAEKAEGCARGDPDAACQEAMEMTS